MTAVLHAGESTQIYQTATLNKVAITPADVVDVTATVYDEDGDVVATSAMVWNAVELYWEYPWNTPASDFTHVYTVKVVVRLSTSDLRWEFAEITVYANKPYKTC